MESHNYSNPERPWHIEEKKNCNRDENKKKYKGKKIRLILSYTLLIQKRIPGGSVSLLNAE